MVSVPKTSVIDLVSENGAHVDVAYFLMSEDNVRRQTALPWVSFGSDAEAPAPEGVFLKYNSHPRAYGNFARLLAKYVRDGEGTKFAGGDPQTHFSPGGESVAARSGALAAWLFRRCCDFRSSIGPGSCDL